MPYAQIGKQRVRQTPSLLPLPDRLLTDAGTSVPGYAEPLRPSKKNMCDRAWDVNVCV